MSSQTLKASLKTTMNLKMAHGEAISSSADAASWWMTPMKTRSRKSSYLAASRSLLSRARTSPTSH